MPTEIIVEVASNHGGEQAWQDTLIESVALAGADTIKFQSYQTKHLSPADIQYAWLRKSQLSDDDHRRLIKKCESVGLKFLTTPFHEDRVPFLADLGLKAIKIGSGEAMRVPLLEAVASNPGWRVYLSTGLLTSAELDKALWILREHEVVLLHCVTKYPCEASEVNMGRMRWLEENTARPCGYSDHTVGLSAALYAIGAGAVCVEVHHSVPGAPRMAYWDKTFQDLTRVVAFRNAAEKMETPGPMFPQSDQERPYVGRWTCDA